MNKTKYWVAIAGVIALGTYFLGMEYADQWNSHDLPNEINVDADRGSISVSERSSEADRVNQGKNGFSDSQKRESHEILSEDQRLLLNRISPVSYRFRTGEVATYTRISGGDIGKVKPEEIYRKDGSSIRALLSDLGLLTGATEELQLEIRRIVKNGETTQVEYRQVIDGAHVSRINRIDYDESGSVGRVSSYIVDASTVDNRLRVLRSEAEAYAREAVRQKIADQFGSSSIEVFTHPIPGVSSGEDTTSLIFDVSDIDSAPSANWRVAVMAVPGGVFTMNIDAMTAQVTEVSGSLYF